MGVSLSTDTFDKLPDDVLMRVARILLREDPQAVGRVVGCSRVLWELVRGAADSEFRSIYSNVDEMLQQLDVLVKVQAAFRGNCARKWRVTATTKKYLRDRDERLGAE